MSTPWRDQTVKQIDHISHGNQANSNVPQINLPPIPRPRSSLAFNAARLRGSMAIAMVLSHAGAGRAATVAASTANILADFVDDALPADLAIVRDALMLSDVGRTLLSSLLGAAVADQYMLALGYRYRCNTRELINLGAAGDYLYDGLSSNSSQVAMAEAKGSIVSTGRKISIVRTAKRGYARQVAPHVWHTYRTPNNTLFIAHGYCIGCGAQVGGGSAIAHVEETTDNNFAGSGGDEPYQLLSKGSESATVHTAIALGCAAGIFAMLNSPRTSDALMRAAVDRQQMEVNLEEFSPIEFRGESFMAPSATRQNLGFALWTPVFNSILNVVQNGHSLTGEVIELPVPGYELTGENSDGGAVLPDGLAVLPMEHYLDAEVSRQRYGAPTDRLKLFSDIVSDTGVVERNMQAQSDFDDLEGSLEESDT